MIFSIFILVYLYTHVSHIMCTSLYTVRMKINAYFKFPIIHFLMLFNELIIIIISVSITTTNTTPCRPSMSNTDKCFDGFQLSCKANDATIDKKLIDNVVTAVNGSPNCKHMLYILN